MYFLAEGPLFSRAGADVVVLGTASLCCWQADAIRRTAVLYRQRESLRIDTLPLLKQVEVRLLQWGGSFKVVRQCADGLAAALAAQLRREEASGLSFNGTSFFLAGSCLSLLCSYTLPGSSLHCCTLSILALAVGDPVGALVGGQLTLGPRASWGKSLVGSTAHVVAVTAALTIATGTVVAALPLAIVSAAAEFIAGSPYALDADDNILVPLLVHLAAILVLNQPTVAASLPGPAESLWPAAARIELPPWTPTLFHLLCSQACILAVVLVLSWYRGTTMKKHE